MHLETICFRFSRSRLWPGKRAIQARKSYLAEPHYRHMAFKIFTGCLTAIGEKVFRLLDTLSVPTCFGERVIMHRGDRGSILCGRLLPGAHVVRGAHR